MIEVPMGMSLKEVIYDIGGGTVTDKKFKAIQVGGPLGGFVPESQLDLQVDYEQMKMRAWQWGLASLLLMRVRVW
jgi:NADH:ubiquinone oxidoreductase subunit F (NADH-binding)